MRHREKKGTLGRNASHRAATLRALSTALIKHKKIKTTLAKAKAARTFVEPLITKAKENTVHARRYVAREINDKQAVRELFGEIIEKIGDRPGGYTRIVKLGNRAGDAADMAILELVDYNELVAKKKTKTKKEKKTEDRTAAETAPVAAEKPREEDIQEAEIVEETDAIKGTDEAESSSESSPEDEIPGEEPGDKSEKKD